MLDYGTNGLEDQKGYTTHEISKIDLTNPTLPTQISVNEVGGKLNVLAIGSVDGESGILGYSYSLDNLRWSEPSLDAFVINDLTYKDKAIYVKAVDRAGNYSDVANSLSTALGVEGIIGITLNTNAWNKSSVIATLEFPSEIPENYELQYKVGTGAWRNGNTAVVTDNCVVYGRLYNRRIDSQVANNLLEVNNIDKKEPTIPQQIVVSKSGNTVIVSANGSVDYESGLAGYIYSIDGINWTSTIPAGSSYTFYNINNISNIKVYAKGIDNVGNTSKTLKK